MYINKADLVDDEMLELVELEIRDLLDEYGFNGMHAAVVCGSARCALEGSNPEIGRNSIEKLLQTLDECVIS